MATESERLILRDLVLGRVSERSSSVRERELCAFLPLKGRKYQRQLMVVGRAVNGWGDSFHPQKLGDPDCRDRISEQVKDFSNTTSHECPMKWVQDAWGPGGGYNSKRSPFWRCVKRTVHELGIASAEDWASTFVWSNLYKVAPRKGNPGNRLRAVQQQGCISLLGHEISAYRPQRLLFVTGYDWAEPFAAELATVSTSHLRFVERAGYMDNASCIIAARPEGQKEDIWVGEIVSTFGTLDAR